MENEKRDILETHLAMEVVSAIVNGALKKYKIQRDRAVDIVMETMQKHPKFLQLLGKVNCQETSLNKILRTRSYHEVNRKARHRIYYELRQYNKNIDIQKSLINSLNQAALHPSESECRPIIDRLVRTHISTRERLNNLDYFYDRLFYFIGEPRSIVDVGCGFHPLLFPFGEKGKGRSVHCYAALDKDPITIAALAAFSGIVGSDVLRPLNWNIKDGWEVVINQTNIRQFDVACLMKLVPVVFRIEQDLVGFLLETPAKTWVITGSKISMTKYENIERRERRIIAMFIERAGKAVVNEFSTGDEFCMIVK